jgi:hypothetical protein
MDRQSTGKQVNYTLRHISDLTLLDESDIAVFSTSRPSLITALNRVKVCEAALEKSHFQS